ncbi:hypothetical protein N9300_00725 [bacterium]|nr:hypothetical protein [bacterium]
MISFSFCTLNTCKTYNDLDLGLHIGGRRFWNEKWGVYLELGVGNTQGTSGGLGLTVKL